MSPVRGGSGLLAVMAVAALQGPYGVGLTVPRGAQSARPWACTEAALSHCSLAETLHQD